MTIKYPCKRCLVQAACTHSCDNEKDYWLTRERFVDRIVQGLMSMAVLTIVGWAWL